MEYKNLKEFVSIVRRNNQTKSKDIRLSMDFANLVHEELTLLLLELQKDDSNNIITLDGGKF